jgi:hypothetical protein
MFFQPPEGSRALLLLLSNKFDFFILRENQISFEIARLSLIRGELLEMTHCPPFFNVELNLGLSNKKPNSQVAIPRRAKFANTSQSRRPRRLNAEQTRHSLD